MIRAAVLLALLGTSAQAQCRIQTAGSSCVTVPNAQRYVSPYAVGDILPRGAYNVLFNATYCGLPPASSGWSYLRVEREVMRVDMATMTVLDVVTANLSHNCR